jgi:hypothetical protein
VGVQPIRKKDNFFWGVGGGVGVGGVTRAKPGGCTSILYINARRDFMSVTCLVCHCYITRFIFCIIY